jgi:AcrR family transcriptional regulator
MNRKEEIIITFARLVRERGYAAVSMRDLAASIGVKAASLYNHIPSKQAMLEEIILRLATEFTSHVEDVSIENLTAQEKLEKIIYHHIDISVDRPYQVAALNNDWYHLEEDAKEKFKQMRLYYETKLRGIIILGIDKKELKNSSPDIILFTILSTLRTLHLWVKKKEISTKEELKKELTELLLRGVIMS